MGAILLYYALRAQIIANRIIQTQIDNQKIEDTDRKTLAYIGQKVQMIQQDISDFSFSIIDYSGTSRDRTKQKFNYQGADAIRRFMETLKFHDNGGHDGTEVTDPKITELNSLLEILHSGFTTLQDKTIREADRVFFTSLLSYQFNSKIKPAFTEYYRFRESNRKPCDICGKKHKGIPDKLFDLVDRIQDLTS